MSLAALSDVLRGHLETSLAPAPALLGGAYPAVSAELPAVAISFSEVAERLRGIGAAPRGPVTGALPVDRTIDLRTPAVAVGGETLPLLSEDRLTLQLPHGGVVRADGTDEPPFAPEDLRVTLGATTFAIVDGPPAAGEAQIRPATGRLTFGAPLPAAGTLSLRYDGVRSDERSDDGASGEHVGSHSLMAKDTAEKEPLRPHATRLATFAATYLAARMVERMPGAAPPPDEGVDWEDALRHFLTHPEQAQPAGAPWWRAPIEQDAIEPRPPEGHVVRPIPAAERVRRAREERRPPLEQRYRDGEQRAEDDFRSAVTTSFIADSALNGAIVGAIVGAIAGGVGAASRWPLGAVAGLPVGAAVGAAACSLGSALGAAADARAGAVVGLAAGGAVTVAGSWAAARAVGAAIAQA